MVSVSTARTTAPSVISAGVNQKLLRSRSRRKLNRAAIPLPSPPALGSRPRRRTGNLSAGRHTDGVLSDRARGTVEARARSTPGGPDEQRLGTTAGALDRRRLLRPGPSVRHVTGNRAA